MFIEREIIVLLIDFKTNQSINLFDFPEIWFAYYWFQWTCDDNRMSFSLSLQASASNLLIPSTFGDFGRAERDRTHKHTNI